MMIRGKKHHIALSLAAASAVLSLAACSTGGDTAGGSANAENQTLVAYTGQAGDYQPNFNPYSPSLIGGIGDIFEPLFFYNQLRADEPEPLLGTEYEWNEEGTELTVTLREDVQWSDGEPFTADDVVFTFNMLKEHPGVNQIGFDGEVEAVDESTVKFTFADVSFVEGPDVLGRAMIVPEHLWADLDPATDTQTEPVGTGPFLLAEFKPQAFTLSANPTYWGGEPELKSVRYVALSGNQAGAQGLSAGNIDWQTGPVPNMDDIEGNYPGYKGITYHLNQMALFTCSNPELGCKGPQTDPAVRKALYYAMDREQLNALAFQNTAAEISPGFALTERDSGVISEELQDKVAPMASDVERATATLEEAGYVKGANGIYAKDGEPLSLTVFVPTGWTDYITALDLISQQAKAAGIEIVSQQVSWNEWSEVRGTGEFELLIDALFQGPAADPYYLYANHFSSANTAPVGENVTPNYARFDNAEVDKALQALRTSDPADTAGRQAHYDAIQRIVEEEMPYIPILTGGTTSQFNVEKFEGWPSEEDLYAVPAVWSRPDNARIFANLKPVGE